MMSHTCGSNVLALTGMLPFDAILPNGDPRLA